MSANDSWWLKLRRAEQHLEHFHAVVDEYVAANRYMVTKEVEGKGKLTRTVHRMHIEQPAVDLMLPLILGDFLSNVRAALNHVVVASVRPRKYRKNAAFPILTENIFERDTDGNYLQRHDDARRAWNTMTRGLSDEARTIVERAQPFNVTDPDPMGLGAKNQILAVLSILQNADKHRELVVVGGYVNLDEYFFVFPDGTRAKVGTTSPPSGQEHHVLEHLAEFGFDDLRGKVDPATVEVKVEGTVEVLVGRSTEDGPMYRLVTLRDILERTRIRIGMLEAAMLTSSLPG